MAERKFPGVEHLARRSSGAFSAVDFVPEDRISEVMQVDPDLMGPPGVNRAFDQTDVPV